MTQPETNPLRIKSYRENRERNFTVTLTGAELYKLLRHLESLAVTSLNYDEVEWSVLLASAIQRQASEQGY